MKRKLFLCATAVFMTLMSYAQTKSSTIEITNNWEYMHFPYKETDEKALEQIESTTWRKAVVPGNVQMDLVRDGVLPDLYFGQNFYSAVWVENEDFMYRTSFEAPDLKGGKHAYLEFDGLDNFSTIWVNGQKIAKTHNMFKTYSFDVTQYLKVGDNKLLIRLASPMKEVYNQVKDAKQILEKLSCAFFVKERLITRKAQMNYGWDNVPRIILSGIYRPVKLRVCNAAKIENVWYRTSISENHSVAKAKVTVELIPQADFKGELEAILSRNGKEFKTSLPILLKKGDELKTLNLEIEVPKPELWWPSGLGEHPLYNLSVKLKQKNQIEDSYNERVAIREIIVKTTPVEKRMVNYRIGYPDPAKKDVMDGGFIGAWSKVPLEKPEEVEVTPLQFYVNGKYVFIKGHNMQPLDVFEQNISREKYYRSVKMAVELGSNMLRIWGGGNVENPALYDACDENGIMVWQDFFYASGQYPNNQEFLDEIEDETINVVKHLRNRACLAAWCGDNESDMVNHDKGAGQFSNKITHVIQKKVMKIYDPDRFWHPSSPSGGGYPRSPWGGDKRNWGAAFPFNDYEYIRNDEGRFISEGGCPSFSQPSSMRRFLPYNAEWPINSDYYFMHWGDVPTMRRDFPQTVTKMIATYFGDAKSMTEFAYLTQVAQAHGLPRMATHFRNRMNECGGVLMWKWADTWPSIVYSIIELKEFKKPAFYSVKRAFAPVALMINNVADNLSVNYLNDLQKLQQQKVMCRLMKSDGSQVKEWSNAVDFGENSSGLAIDLGININDYRSGDYYLKIWVENNNSVSPYYYFPADMVKFKQKPSDVKIEVKRISPSNVQLTMTASEFSPYFVIYSENPYISYSDNTLFLEKNTPQTITISVKEGELWGDFDCKWWGGGNKTLLVGSQLLSPPPMKPTVYP
jgi:beta-mannosidase